METYNPPKEVEEKEDDSELPKKEVISEKWLREKIDSLIPLIKEKWPTVAQQTLETAKGSIDDLVEVISIHSGTSAIGIKSQLFEIIDSIQENNWEISEKIEPIESQLEELLEELNNTLRPKIESPIRKKPLLSIAIAAGIGLLIGTLLNSGRK
jgi:gas vesicle protein